MGKVVLGMTMSLDGFINDRNGSVAALYPDELHVNIMPIFLGGGLRAFEEIDDGQIKLERIKVMELPGGRTHLRFRVIK